MHARRAALSRTVNETRDEPPGSYWSPLGVLLGSHSSAPAFVGIRLTELTALSDQYLEFLDVHRSGRKPRVTCKRGIPRKGGLARITGIARVAPISVPEHPVEPVAGEDGPEISTFDIDYVAVLPRQPPDPLSGSVEDVLAPPKGDPPPVGVVEVLNGLC